MLKNYLTTALRNLWKQKGFTAINLTGLALGMACSLLILLWVQDERSVDNFHAKGNRLFYVYERNHMGGKLQTWYWTQGPLAAELKKMIPEVEGATGIASSYTGLFSVGEKKIKEEGFAAGPDLFSMFSYPLVEGNGVDALSAPDGIAISRRMAISFFGSAEAAIGKAIRYNNNKDLMVRAVYEDLSPRVSYRGEFIASWSGFVEDGNGWAKDFGSVDPSTCVLLKAGANPAAVEAKMRHLLDNYQTEIKENKIELALQRFGDRYLHSDFDSAGVPTGGRIAYVQLFSIIALFILVIACINFMNLTTARSVRRAKEIGVRKVMGAVRGLLIRQFIGEAVLMAFFAAALALMLAALALPAFNQLTGKTIVLPLQDWGFWISLAGIILLTGLLSGGYPAFYLSGFNPIRVLKAAMPSGTRGDALFRKGLVVFQFTLSIILILATILITQQIHYMHNARLGYDRENLVYLPIEGEMGKKLGVLQTEVAQLPGVAQLTLYSGSSPTTMGDGTLGMNWTGKDPNETVRFIHETIGRDFLKTMKIELIAGRDFSPDFPTDSNAVILNETAVKTMGYKDPVGKTLKIYNYPLHIVGVVKDFHFQSMHDALLPLALFQGRNEWFSTVVVRTKPGQTRVALAGLEKLYRQLNPAFPFSYKFADAEYAALYKSEEVTGRLSVIFALLAISISCLGLLGLSLFTAEQRMREIGIRKVLGAGVPALFLQLTRNFMGLVGLAFLIATPLGWWAMHQWLAGFAYPIAISAWTFLFAGGMAVLVALVTVGWQTLRAARANPVKSLRSE
jgi:putative ABC transport system permease protein